MKKKAIRFLFVFFIIATFLSNSVLAESANKVSLGKPYEVKPGVLGFLGGLFKGSVYKPGETVATISSSMSSNSFNNMMGEYLSQKGNSLKNIPNNPNFAQSFKNAKDFDISIKFSRFDKTICDLTFGATCDPLLESDLIYIKEDKSLGAKSYPAASLVNNLADSFSVIKDKSGNPVLYQEGKPIIFQGEDGKTYLKDQSGKKIPSSQATRETREDVSGLTITKDPNGFVKVTTSYKNGNPKTVSILDPDNPDENKILTALLNGMIPIEKGKKQDPQAQEILKALTSNIPELAKENAESIAAYNPEQKEVPVNKEPAIKEPMIKIPQDAFNKNNNRAGYGSPK